MIMYDSGKMYKATPRNDHTVQTDLEGNGGCGQYCTAWFLRLDFNDWCARVASVGTVVGGLHGDGVGEGRVICSAGIVLH